MKISVQKANSYVFEAIKAGSSYKIGEGVGPINHMYDL